ncbi:hypothetical protein AVEN_51643-1 [Araneus ventricosus]|uniref:Secreted protein n=1 Tax=Araneus ventricosus TaxID=182803 RepID=A0A4Y2MUP2_ARAVE|nr:hypothetical protein AVEN_51643-1 [Araneus ventricosus]
MAWCYSIIPFLLSAAESITTVPHHRPHLDSPLTLLNFLDEPATPSLLFMNYTHIHSAFMVRSPNRVMDIRLCWISTSSSSDSFSLTIAFVTLPVFRPRLPVT